MASFIDQLRFGADVLIPIVTQDAQSGELLMVAWANAEAVETTVAEGRAVYWSRFARQTLAQRRRIGKRAATR